MLAYLLGRDSARFATSRQLPLWWPMEVAAVMVLGLVIITALYLSLMFTGLRWAWRLVR